MIIAFEGVDKAGKQTQSTMLCASLQKLRLSADVIDFPTRDTPTGDAVSAYIRYHAQPGRPAHLANHVMPCLAAADLWAAAQRIESALKRYDVLILNRSPASNITYGTAAGLGRAWLRNLTAGHPASDPDCTVLLDISVSESFRRQPENRDAFESDRGFLARARESYLSEAARCGWVVVRATRPPVYVHSTILRRLMPRIREEMRRRL